jgi:hypothetical protein
MNIIYCMITERWLTQRSFSFLIAAFLVIASTSLTITHWHDDPGGQDCNLCHGPHLPLIESLVAAREPLGITITRSLPHQEVLPPADTFLSSIADRAPPASIFFTNI